LAVVHDIVIQLLR